MSQLAVQDRAEDKRARVILALKDVVAKGRRVSDRQLARECQVSQPFVSSLRRQLEKGTSDLERAAHGAAGNGDLADGDNSARDRSFDLALVGRDLEEEARILEARLEALRLERLKLTEQVVRGGTSREVLTRMSRDALELERELADNRSLQESLSKLARQQDAENEVRLYHQAVEAAETAYAAASQEAQAIDALIEELGSAVNRLRAYAGDWADLRHHANRVGGRRLVEALAVWGSQFAGLEAEIMNRLRSVGALDGSVDPRARARRVVTWLPSWTKRLIETARTLGPELRRTQEQND